MASVGPRRRLCVVGRFVGSAQNGPGGLPTKYGEIFKEVIVGIYRHKRFKVAIGVAMVALAVVVAVVIAGDSKVVAKGSGGYDQVSSAEDIKQARGIVDAFVTTETSANAIVNGEWILSCDGPCAEAKLFNIEFDMSFAMRNPDGSGRHAHQMSDFSATSVALDSTSDTLTIVGIITGSRHIGTNGITIRLVDVGPGGNAKFYFQLTEPTSIVSEVGGSIVESR